MTSFIQDQRLLELCARIPGLAAPREISLLEGGLTNLNYRVFTDSGSFVLRISNAATGLLGINREQERVNTRIAWLAGTGPPVIESPGVENVLVVGWIEARTLHAADLQENPAQLERVADAIRNLHHAPVFTGIFHFPSLRKKYLRTVTGSGYFLPEEYLQLEPKITELEKMLEDHPEPLVSCHNDLLAENFMDDGNSIRIIDYEYAGLNVASFDLGNFAAESFLTDRSLENLCRAYWSIHSEEKIARAMAWSVISRYGWVLWASIQEAVSPIRFDFRSWGLRKWNSVYPELTGNRYPEVLNKLRNSLHA